MQETLMTFVQVKQSIISTNLPMWDSETSEFCFFLGKNFRKVHYSANFSVHQLIGS